MFLKRWLPVIVWAVIIFIFSGIATIKTSQVFFWDFIFKKTAHLTEYFIFYLLLFRAFNFGKKANSRQYLTAFIMLILYAISDEFHQSFTPGRDARARDVFIDGIGGLTAIWTIKNFLQKVPKKLLNWLMD